MTAEVPPGPAAPKAEWRDWARRVRSRIDIAGMSGAVVDGIAGWEPLRRSAATLIYLPLVDEIDLRPLIESDLEGSFYSTRTPDRGGELTIHLLGGPLEVHRLGFLQPHASAPRIDVRDLDVILLPGLAFDLWGTRLGRGAGYYDKLLVDAARATRLVGVAPTGVVVDRLPGEAHDVPVGFLATEEGVDATAG